MMQTVRLQVQPVTGTDQHDRVAFVTVREKPMQVVALSTGKSADPAHCGPNQVDASINTVKRAVPHPVGIAAAVRRETRSDRSGAGAHPAGPGGGRGLPG